MAAHYDYSKATKMSELFSDEFVKDLEIKRDQITGLKYKRGKRVKHMFVRNVFTFFMQLVINDCIERNIKFLYSGRYWFYIYIKKINKGNFDRIVKNKTYKSVDMISSDFNIYEFVFYSVYMDKENRYRRIRIIYEKYNQLIDQVNKGKRYFK